MIEYFTEANWHVTGNVVGQVPASLGLEWSCAAFLGLTCELAAGYYAGIEFTIQGEVGPSHALLLTLGRLDDETPAEGGTGCGSCVAATCIDPSFVIDLSDIAGTGMSKTVRVL